MALQEWCCTTVVDWYLASGWKRKINIFLVTVVKRASKCYFNLPLVLTFGWLAMAIRGEQDLDLLQSLFLLPAPWWCSLVLTVAASLSGLLSWWWPPKLPSGLQAKSLTLWSLFWHWLRLQVYSTENSSPEGDSINTARPSSDLMMISLPGPRSTSQEGDSGHFTSKWRLQRGCKKKNKKPLWFQNGKMMWNL